MTLRLEEVSVVRDAGTPWAHAALHELDLTVEPGERVVVTGGNGAGKSTLAAVLAGAMRPTSGRATLDGVALEQRIERIGLVIQHARLQLQRPTVAAELAVWGLVGAMAGAALRRVGLPADLGRRRVDELSVGQQRRLCLAATLARPVDLLVLDEPLAGLDRSGVDAFVEALRSLDERTIVVAVTHELDALERLGERSVRLDAGTLVVDAASGAVRR